MQLKDILQKYSQEKIAKETPSAEPKEVTASVEKTAYEQGAEEAQNMVKIANALGDIIGNRAADIMEARLAQSFGYDPEVMKTASMTDVIFDAMTKVAEQVGGTAAQNAVSTAHAEELQISESAAHHANLAAASAADAIQSLAQGDEHSATQLLATAGGAIEVAKNFASRIPGNAAVAQQVNEANSIVAAAANQAAAHAQA